MSVRDTRLPDGEGVAPVSPTSLDSSSAAALNFDDIGSITRISRACERCRRRKVRCEGTQPCSTCFHHQETCVYRPGPPRFRRRFRAPSDQQQHGSASSKTPSNTALCDGEAPPPTLSVKQWHAQLQTGIGVSNSETSFQFYGPSSHPAFIQRAYERLNPQPHAVSENGKDRQVPPGIRAWGLERFFFSLPDSPSPKLDTALFIPRQVGDRFLRNYFKIVHPYMPILSYAEVMSHWSRLWEVRPTPGPPWTKEIVFTALAIGARVCPTMGQDDLDSADAWAEHFSQAVDIPITAMREPSLQLVHLLLLKAAYAQHGLRPNDTFFYVGCASRTCIAMGYNRSAAVDGFGEETNQYRLTFWITYIMDRTTTLMIGRPSTFRDEDIDAPYPHDPCETDVLLDVHRIPPCGFITDWSFVRIMARMGKIADCIMSGIYSSQKISDARDRLMETNIHGCESALEAVCQDLPDYLDFRNIEGPVANDWQEVQRLHVGVIYHMLRILVHRPALVFATFFPSVAEAQSNIPASFPLRQSLETLIASAKGLIRLAHESLSVRQPDARSDSSLAIYIVAACVTLLYEVLDPETTPAHARDTFSSVEEATRCLEGMKHFGPTAGKTISTDIMRMAKNVLACPAIPSLNDMGNEFISAFPWLDIPSNNASEENDEAPVEKEQYNLARNVGTWSFLPPTGDGGVLLPNLDEHQF